MAIYGADGRGRVASIAAPIADNLLFLGYFLTAVVTIVFDHWARSVNSPYQFGDSEPAFAPFFLSPLFVAMFVGITTLGLEIFSWVRLARLRAKTFPGDKAPFFLDILNKEAKACGLSRPPKTYWLPSVYPIGARVFGGFRSRMLITGGLFASASQANEEALYVLRHEMAHIKNRDTRLYVIVFPALIAPLLLLLDFEEVGYLALNLAVIYSVTIYLLRRREYLADAAAMNASASRDVVEGFLSKAAGSERGWFHPSVERRLKAVKVGSPVLRARLGFLGISVFLVLASLSRLGDTYRSSDRVRYLLGYLLWRLLYFLLTAAPFVCAALELSKGVRKKVPAISSQISSRGDKAELAATLCFAGAWWWFVIMWFRVQFLLHMRPGEDRDLLFDAIEIGAAVGALVGIAWLVAGFGLLRRAAWARGLAIGLALWSVFWHYIEPRHGQDLMEFGSYGESVGGEQYILVPLVFVAAISSGIAIIVLLMSTKTKIAFGSSNTLWRTIPGFVGAVAVAMAVAGMAVPELKTVSLMNERQAARISIMKPVIPEISEEPPTPVSEALALGLLKTRPEPVYPDAARAANISGDVVVAIVVARDGVVQEATVVSGHPLLTESAVQAVKAWQFRPFNLNGDPVRFATNVRVRFSYSPTSPTTN